MDPPPEPIYAEEECDDDHSSHMPPLMLIVLRLRFKKMIRIIQVFLSMMIGTI